MSPSPIAVVTELVRRVSTWRSLVVGLSVLIIAGLSTAPECAAQKFVDESSQVKVTKSGLVLNRATNTFNSVVTIKNTSATVLNEPLVLVISSLAPTTVTLANPSGQDPSGNPFVNLKVPSGGLSPGQTISNVLLEFQNPNRVAFSFGTMVAFRSGAAVAPDGSSVVFKNPTGATVLTIPLLNQEVVSPTNVTTVTHERVNISDDGGHAGVYTITFAADPADGATEALVTGTFRYFDSGGQLWQIVAPLGTDFFLPIDKSQRLFTPDGSRVLMINTDEGNTDPVFTVYDNSGNVLNHSSGAFLELYEAQIAPNGGYLLVMGIVKSNGTYGNLIRVTDISANLSSDFPFDIVNGGRPVIGISSDGRFLISYQGSHVVLP